MRRLPLILSGLFLAITLSRVANLVDVHMRAGALGWLFSAGLGVAVIASAYWTRYSNIARRAWFALFFFVGVDVVFNFAHVWISADVPAQLAAISPWLLVVATILYGVFPTAAVALLGGLQASINRLPPTRSESAVRAAATARLLAWLQPPAQTVQTIPQTAQAPQTDPAMRYVCVTCGAGYAKPQSLAAHSRAHLAKRTNGHGKEKVKQ